MRVTEIFDLTNDKQNPNSEQPLSEQVLKSHLEPLTNLPSSEEDDNCDPYQTVYDLSKESSRHK